MMNAFLALTEAELETLYSLDLSSHSFYFTFEKIKEKLPRCRKLVELKIEDCHLYELNDVQLAALGDIIGKLPALEQLSFSGNYFSSLFSNPVSSLFKPLRQSSTLRILSLSRCQICLNSEFTILMDALANIRGLTSLDFSYNSLRKQSHSNIDAWSKLSSIPLQTLVLTGNEFGFERKKLFHLSQILAQYPDLIQIYWDDNCLHLLQDFHWDKFINIFISSKLQIFNLSKNYLKATQLVYLLKISSVYDIGQPIPDTISHLIGSWPQKYRLHYAANAKRLEDSLRLTSLHNDLINIVLDYYERAELQPCSYPMEEEVCKGFFNQYRQAKREQARAAQKQEPLGSIAKLRASFKKLKIF